MKPPKPPLMHRVWRSGWTVALKELRGLFGTPAAYIAVVLFIGVSEFIFFRNVFLIGDASLAAYFDMLPWFLLFLVPALTMGSFAQERETGTYEGLITKPLSEHAVVLGKYFANVLFVGGAVAFAVFPIAVAFSFSMPSGVSLDWGAVLGGYAAALFLVAVFTALGLYVSSLFTKQVSALLLTVVLCFVLIIIGSDLVAGAAPLAFALLFERLSVLSHFGSMARGVIDTRDVWYFLTVSFAFLALTHYRLVRFRFGGGHVVLRRARMGVGLVVAIVLVSNVFGALLPGRLDLTVNGRYTLSPTTLHVLETLPDIVHVTLYASARLPAQLQPVLRTTRDLLHDYARYGEDSIVLSIVSMQDQTTDPETVREAEARGIEQVQFNVMTRDQFQAQQGFLGVVLSYAGKDKSIPFVSDTGDLEYRLTSMLLELTRTERKHVRFVSDAGGGTSGQGYTRFARELKAIYDVSDTTLGTSAAVATDTDVLVVAGATVPLGGTARAAIDRYVDEGGALLALLDGTAIDQRALTAAENPTDVFEIVRRLGVTLGNDLVYDLAIGASEVVQVQNGSRTFLVPYPFWVRASVVPGSMITDKLTAVIVPWASSLTTDATTLSARHATATSLVRTSSYTGVQRGSFSIAPNSALTESDLAERVLGYAVEGAAASSTRAVIFGSSKMLDDTLLGQGEGGGSASNLALGLAAVAWLAQDESLAAIKAKGDTRRPFGFEDEQVQTLVSYGTMTGSILVFLLLGLIGYVRRRARTRLTYTMRPMA